MIPHLPATRAAENFARALDGEATPEVAERYSQLVATATLMRETTLPEPRPEFVADLRARLMEAAETELVPVASTVRELRPAGRAVPRRSARERHLGAAAAAAVLVAATGGVAVAAESSLPGDTLYPIKRGIEQAQVSMNRNEAARGAEYLAQANTRLTEVRALVEDDGTSEQIGATLADFNEQSAKGSELIFRSYQRDGKAEDISTVREFTSSQMDALDSIADMAPPTSVNEFGESAALLAEIDQQARVLCAECSGLGAVSAPAQLVQPTGIEDIGMLVAAPAIEVGRALRQALSPDLAEIAERAEQQAGQTPVASPPSADQAPDTSSPQLGTGGGAPALPSDSVTKLVDGLTTSLPLPEAVKQTTRPLLDPVTGVLDGTVGELVDPLDDTVTGLLGDD